MTSYSEFISFSFFTNILHYRILFSTIVLQKPVKDRKRKICTQLNTTYNFTSFTFLPKLIFTFNRIPSN